jgi:predicted nucleic acid-binding protein
MNIMTDTNIFLTVVLEESQKERIIQLTTGCNAISPEILPYEIGNALSAMIKRKKLSKDEALQVQKKIETIPVRLISVDIYEALKIAIDNNIYAYDAYFLQCAKSLSCPLLTLDKNMKIVAKKIGISVLE